MVGNDPRAADAVCLELRSQSLAQSVRRLQDALASASGGPQEGPIRAVLEALAYCEDPAGPPLPMRMRRSMLAVPLLALCELGELELARSLVWADRWHQEDWSCWEPVWDGRIAFPLRASTADTGRAERALCGRVRKLAGKFKLDMELSANAEEATFEAMLGPVPVYGPVLAGGSDEREGINDEQ